MGIENLGNNDFGKLQLTNLNNAKAQKNSKDLANEQIKKEELKNINLNQGVLQAGQTDLAQAYFNNDNDIAKGEEHQDKTKVGFSLVGLALTIIGIVKAVKNIKAARDQMIQDLQNQNGNLGGAFGVGVPTTGITGGGLN